MVAARLRREREKSHVEILKQASQHKMSLLNYYTNLGNLKALFLVQQESARFEADNAPAALNTSGSAQGGPNSVVSRGNSGLGPAGMS